MRKWICALLVLLLPTGAFALGGGDVRIILEQRSDQTVATPGSSCNPAADEVGYRTVEASSTTLLGDRIYVYHAVAECTGSLGDAYLYYDGVNTGREARVCIYNEDGDDAPDVGDTLVACSADFTSNGITEWRTGAFSGGTVTSGNHYWVAIHIGSPASDWVGRKTTTISRYYIGDVWSDGSPSDLSGSWTEQASNAPISGYATIE